MIDLDDLEAKTKAATPGPWRVNSNPPILKLSTLVDAPRLDGAADRMAIAVLGNHNPETPANAAFVAAVNPSTVLALIARIRELEDELCTGDGATCRVHQR